MSSNDLRDRSKVLSEEDKLYVFRRATSSFEASQDRWIERAANGMSDQELKEALEFELGVGGGCGPGRPSYDYNKNGLRIWGSWGYNNTVKDKPLWKGMETVSMARKVYCIKNPSDPRQFDIFDLLSEHRSAWAAHNNAPCGSTQNADSGEALAHG